MECPSCRATVPEGGKFCMECGAPLPRACPVCGHPIAAAAKFCPECGASLTGDGAKPGLSQTTATTQQPAPAPVSSAAERRQLTVMFCDLVGSTALATRLDPEDLRAIIGAYHRRVAKVVGRYDGFIAKYMGDGVVVYFGYPQAHEEDAERAVRAGLKLAETMHRVRPRADVELQVCREKMFGCRSSWLARSAHGLRHG